jgi:hyperosmotically inducible protein
MTKSLLVASLSAMVGLSASANSNQYPDVKSSSANINSSTSNRLQDPTNPNGAYDTDKSGYANRWNAEDRISAQPHDETHWHARGARMNNPAITHTSTSSTSSTTVSTTRSSADLDQNSNARVGSNVNSDVSSNSDKGMYQGAYTGVSREKDTDQYSGINSPDNALVGARNAAQNNGVITDRSDRSRSFKESDRSTVHTSMSGAEEPKSAEQSSDTSYRADNSGLNKRDRNEKADTADHQASKGTKGDVELTRKIRRELTKDDSLSTYAKNVKIITKNGQTTLRGPVSNSEEKDKIETAAERIVGTNKVRNELEIKH